MLSKILEQQLEQLTFFHDDELWLFRQTQTHILFFVNLNFQENEFIDFQPGFEIEYIILAEIVILLQTRDYFLHFFLVVLVLLYLFIGELDDHIKNLHPL